MLALWPWISSLLDCEKSISIVYKLPILWYFSYSLNWKEQKENNNSNNDKEVEGDHTHFPTAGPLVCFSLDFTELRFGHLPLKTC